MLSILLLTNKNFSEIRTFLLLKMRIIILFASVVSEQPTETQRGAVSMKDI